MPRRNGHRKPKVKATEPPKVEAVPVPPTPAKPDELGGLFARLDALEKQKAEDKEQRVEDKRAEHRHRWRTFAVSLAALLLSLAGTLWSVFGTPTKDTVKFSASFEWQEPQREKRPDTLSDRDAALWDLQTPVPHPYWKMRLSNLGTGVTVEQVLVNAITGIHILGAKELGIIEKPEQPFVAEQLLTAPKTLAPLSDGLTLIFTPLFLEPKTITVVTTGGATFTFIIPPRPSKAK